jgi:hypothetical protein
VKTSAYFVVYVADMDRATAFSRDALGVEVGFSSPDWTSLAIGSTAVGLHGGADGTQTTLRTNESKTTLLPDAARPLGRAARNVDRMPKAEPPSGRRPCCSNRFSITLASHG